MGGGASRPWSQRFSDALDRFVTFLEKDRLSILMVFLYVLALSLFRDLSEYFLLDQNFVDTAHPWIFSIANHVGFYLVSFMGLVLLLFAFSGRGLRRSINFVCCIYWVIVLPPYLDHFLFGQKRELFLPFGDGLRELYTAFQRGGVPSWTGLRDSVPSLFPVRLHHMGAKRCARDIGGKGHHSDKSGMPASVQPFGHVLPGDTRGIPARGK